MLAGEAREAIGEVGEATRPVRTMLENIGFTYRNMIDPFDGGPHYWADTSKVVPVKNTRLVKPLAKRLLKAPPSVHGSLMAISKKRVRVVQADVALKGNDFVLDEALSAALDVEDAAEFYFLEMGKVVAKPKGARKK